MMPLTTVNNDGTLNNASGLSAWMQQAHAGGVNGYAGSPNMPALMIGCTYTDVSVMLDFWWGIVEQAGPKMYNWTPYASRPALSAVTARHLPSRHALT